MRCESRRAWWILAMGLDLVLLGLAAWLCLASPLSRPWAYGLASICIVVGALAACAVPLLPPSTTQPQGPPQRVRPDPARIRVQLTRL
ncbi:MAG: hypothetical protein KF833_20725 [Verrucomicrobiae bacterium]|nr:hypothetical protein [Verrucomicrobiae bacterium]